MDQRTRNFYVGGGFPDEMETFAPEQEPYDSGGDYETYEQDPGEYDYDYPDTGSGGFEQESSDYAVYEDEREGMRRFHVAMNALNSVSVLAGVVVIFVLTALIVTMVSWLQEDILHSVVLLQSGIQ